MLGFNRLFRGASQNDHQEEVPQELPPDGSDDIGIRFVVDVEDYWCGFDLPERPLTNDEIRRLGVVVTMLCAGGPRVREAVRSALKVAISSGGDDLVPLMQLMDADESPAVSPTEWGNG